MARVTTDHQLTRRARVAELELRGSSAPVIAREVGCDVRTVRADFLALAQERAQDANLAGERHRLLDAAKLVEHESWALFHALSGADSNGKLGALGKVLAAQAQGAKVVGDLAAADLERRLADLEQRLAVTDAGAIRSR